MVIDIGFCIFIGICSGVAVIVSNLGKRQREPFAADKADFYYEDVYSRYAAQKDPKDLTPEYYMGICVKSHRDVPHLGD